MGGKTRGGFLLLTTAKGICVSSQIFIGLLCLNISAQSLTASFTSLSLVHIQRWCLVHTQGVHAQQALGYLPAP